MNPVKKSLPLRDLKGRYIKAKPVPDPSTAPVPPHVRSPSPAASPSDRSSPPPTPPSSLVSTLPFLSPDIPGSYPTSLFVSHPLDDSPSSSLVASAALSRSSSPAPRHGPLFPRIVPAPPPLDTVVTPLSSLVSSPSVSVGSSVWPASSSTSSVISTTTSSISSTPTTPAISLPLAQPSTLPPAVPLTSAPPTPQSTAV